MKPLLTIFTLVFTVMFSSTSYAEWTKVSEDTMGNTFYVDFERIRKHGGYVYWWDLTDFLKPTRHGDLSGTIYKQGDCKLFQEKWLSLSFYKQPMGGGTGDTVPVPKKHKDWISPPRNSSAAKVLKAVCSR